MQDWGVTASARLRTTIALSFLLLVGSFSASTWKLGKLDPGIVFLQLTFSETEFHSVLKEWGEDGVARFRSHFAWDFGTLASYAVLGRAAGRWVVGWARATGPAALLLPWLLALAAVADFAENVLQLRFIGPCAREVAPILFVVAGTCASTKLVLLTSWPLIAASLLLRRDPFVPTQPTKN